MVWRWQKNCYASLWAILIPGLDDLFLLGKFFFINDGKVIDTHPYDMPCKAL